MKTMKFFTTVRIKATIFLSCILALCALVYYSLSVYEKRRTLEPEVYDLLSACPAAESYADSSLIYLLNETVIEVFRDGTVKKTVHQVFKILKEEGKAFADYEVGFFSNKETITFLYARTITPEGEVIPVKKRGLKAVAPESDQYRFLSFSMPQVTVGSVVDWKYMIEKKQREIDGGFADNFLMQGQNPVLLSTYEIIVPKDMVLKCRTINPLEDGVKSPIVTEYDGWKTYLWESRNVPPILDEEYMPSLPEIASRILVTTFDSWEECFKWNREKIKGKSEPDERIKEKVAQLTKGLTNSRDKIKAVFEFVARDIKYSSAETFFSSGHEPADAPHTFGCKLGDCKDKSILLISMLKTAGIPAYYVLIPTHTICNLRKDFPSPFQFDHVIVAVEEGKGYRYLDPVAEYYNFDYLPDVDQNRDVLILKDHATVFARTPLEDTSNNAFIRQQHIKIMANGAIEVEVTDLRSGSREAAARSGFINLSPTEIKKAQINYVAEVSPWAILLEHTFTDPKDLKKDFIQHRRYYAPDYCKKAGDILLFRVPSIGENCPGIDKEKRQYPISFWAKSYRKHEVKFNVPEGYEIYHLPEQVLMKNPYFQYRSSYHSNGSNVFYQGQFSRKALEIPVEECADYRKYGQDVEKNCERYVLFREKK